MLANCNIISEDIRQHKEDETQDGMNMSHDPLARQKPPSKAQGEPGRRQQRKDRADNIKDWPGVDYHEIQESSKDCQGGDHETPSRDG